MRAAGMAPKRSSRSASVIPVDVGAIGTLLSWVPTIRWQLPLTNIHVVQELDSRRALRWTPAQLSDHSTTWLGLEPLPKHAGIHNQIDRVDPVDRGLTQPGVFPDQVGVRRFEFTVPLPILGRAVALDPSNAKLLAYGNGLPSSGVLLCFAGQGGRRDRPFNQKPWHGVTLLCVVRPGSPAGARHVTSLPVIGRRGLRQAAPLRPYRPSRGRHAPDPPAPRPAGSEHGAAGCVPGHYQIDRLSLAGGRPLRSRRKPLQPGPAGGGPWPGARARHFPPGADHTPAPTRRPPGHSAG